MRDHYRNGDAVGLVETGCDGCSPSMINGLLCHEQGCREAWRDTPTVCSECGCYFFSAERYQATCPDCVRNHEEEEEQYDSTIELINRIAHWQLDVGDDFPVGWDRAAYYWLLDNRPEKVEQGTFDETDLEAAFEALGW